MEPRSVIYYLAVLFLSMLRLCFQSRSGGSPSGKLLFGRSKAAIRMEA